MEDKISNIINLLKEIDIDGEKIEYIYDNFGIYYTNNHLK